MTTVRSIGSYAQGLAACGDGNAATGRADARKSAKEVEMPNPAIKDESLYEDLRRRGDSKQKAARISNAAAARGRSNVGKAGGRSGSYQDWTVPELKKRAKELGISGYSKLSKNKLISKLRNH
jgi:hypothetical protein